MAILEEISSFLQQGRAPIVKEKVQEAIDQGLEPKEILEKGLLEGMGIIGEKFKKNEVFVPEVLIAARAMNAGVAILKPYLVEAGVESKGTVVIGTVKGDLHDIGKNLVKMMLEGKGLKVIDLGVDVPSEQFIQAAIDNDAQIICCSALLTTTMNEMKNVVIAAQEKGIRNKVKIMVGGAPITQNFCDSIDADGYAADAASAADAALAMCS
ncbi:MAG: corrinoid protein [Oscillospiraceae bacterium]|nr:corrinoid protein [Oscillospiraceae bacterium]